MAALLRAMPRNVVATQIPAARGIGAGGARLPWRPSTAAATLPIAMGIRAKHTVSLVLLEQVDELGYKGEVVEVKAGYARNYLIPSRQAVYATDEHRAKFAVRLRDADAQRAAELRARSALKRAVESMELFFTRATTDGSKLYGSVTAEDICEAAAESRLALSLRRRDVRLGEDGAPIRTVGEHTVQVRPAAGLWCDVRVTVISE